MTKLPPLPRECRPPFPKGYRDANPYHWNADELDGLLEWVIAQATELRRELPGAWRRVVDWTPGLSASTGPAVGGGRVGDDGATNGRTQAAALAALTDTSSGAAQDFHVIALGLVQSARIAGRMTAARLRLRVAEPAEDVVEPDRRSGIGNCVNPVCGEWCPGTPEKRRKRGLCPRCFSYWEKRKGEPLDAQMRPHAVCHPERIDGCQWCKRQELIDAGVAPNDTVSLVDEAVGR